MKFAEWLEKNCINVNALAKKIKVSHHQLYKARDGKKISVDIALKIVSWTKKEVTFEDLVNDQKHPQNSIKKNNKGTNSEKDNTPEITISAES